MNDEITLKLPREAVHDLIRRLAKFPYEEVFVTLRSIDVQLTAQSQPVQGGLALVRPESGRLAKQGTDGGP